MAAQIEQYKQVAAETDKYKTLSTLSSGMAHEIKNPLTAIKTFTEYLPYKMNDKAFLKKFSKIVGTEVDRINHIVHELLDYSKPHPLEVKPHRIHTVLDDTLDFFNTQIVEKKIRLIKNYRAPKDLIVPFDLNQIRQALVNLILNAIEAMPDGGSLTITTSEIQGMKDDGRSGKPERRGTRDERRIEITISDTGKGIPKKDLPHLFDPFFTKKDTGTGLGLSITQSVIEQHGGKIEVRSKVGVGTEFLLIMPIEKVRRD